jgi:ATP/maltotriose-dependent transcriptional regulator MalT
MTPMRAGGSLVEVNDARRNGATTLSAEPLVGRGDVVRSLDGILDDADAGLSRAVELVGEAGIGKTRLLRELAVRADARGHLVLVGGATELERDLPFSAFVDALDPYVAGLESAAFDALDAQARTELAHVFPSLWALASGVEVVPQHERYRSHRAVRALLEQLAGTRPLVLVLDDLHWADPASVELINALLRRPPNAAVVMAFGRRPLAMSERLPAALEHARRSGSLDSIGLAGLSPAESTELLGSGVDGAEAGALYEECGGNPFYLEQLARSLERAGGFGRRTEHGLDGLGVPPAVAASLNEELGLLSPHGRLAFEGAAVAGDPFDLELAAAAAATSEAATQDAVDELLRLDLIRATDVPRRFRFRHPLVRRAAYESTAAAWRVAAHERCAAALAARGTSASGRAHHVERSARHGDLTAVAILREAGDEAARLAPESAARWFGAALRSLPDTAPVGSRTELLLARAWSLAAVGRFADSHRAVLEAIEIVPGQPSRLRTTVATSCASIERFLGSYEQAHDRLLDALRVVGETASIERVELLIELTLNEFYRSRYGAMRDWAGLAVDAADAAGDPVLMAGASVMPALADAMTGPSEGARSRRDQAAALVDRLTDDELSRRPEAAGWLAIGEVYLDLFAEADDHASRALRLARTAWQGDPLHRLYPVLPRIWYVRGKLAEATELLDGAIEASRLLGSPPALAGNLFNRSAVALAVGDLDIALATAEEGVELTRGLDPGFVAAWAGARMANVLIETGDAARAVDLLVERAGGEELTLIPGGWRAYWLELLTRCQLALARPAEAERAAGLAAVAAASTRLPLATAWADRAAAAVALFVGDTSRAIERALASADGADTVGAPIEAALSRTLAGRALAEAGRTDGAVAELQRAAESLDACGALRYRDSAERELGKLGHRPHRRTRPGESRVMGIESLTERELQVAWLVVDRRTNPEIAADLFLSQKTVETHLRNIFTKAGVANRVELARAVERSERVRGGPPP